MPGPQRELFHFAELICSHWAAILANVKIDGDDREEGSSVSVSLGERVSTSGGFLGGAEKGVCACTWVRG